MPIVLSNGASVHDRELSGTSDLGALWSVRRNFDTGITGQNAINAKKLTQINRSSKARQTEIFKAKHKPRLCLNTMQHLSLANLQRPETYRGRVQQAYAAIIDQECRLLQACND